MELGDQSVKDKALELTRAEWAVRDALWEVDGDARAAASHLSLSVETVETHLRNIRRKLGVSSTLGAFIALRKREDR